MKKYMGDLNNVSKENSSIIYVWN